MSDDVLVDALTDANAYIASLRSQNQALQEDKDELYAEREEDARRIAALQEALREVGLAAHVNHPLLPGEITVGMFDTCPYLPCVKASNALSPTQETDPPANSAERALEGYDGPISTGPLEKLIADDPRGPGD